MLPSIGALIAVMAIAGSLGGLANFLDTRLDKERLESEALWYFARCIVLGLIGAFCVPLFLSIIQSDIIKDAQSNETSLLVFGGFCILAAFFSRKFLDSMAARALKIAEQAKTKSEEAAATAKSVKEEVKPVLDKETEESTEVTPTIASAISPSIEPKKLALLKELTSGSFTFRSIYNLARKTQMLPDEAEKLLKELQIDKLANESSARTGRSLWYATARGRQLVNAPPISDLSAETKIQVPALPPTSK